MTTGSYYITTDRVTRAKTWSGSDGKTSENPYTCSFSLFNDKLYVVETVYLGRVIDATPQAPSDTQATSRLFDDPNLLLKAQSKLLDSVRGSSFNAAVSAAELPESLRMLVGSVRGFFQAYNHARRGDFRSAARQLARVPSARYESSPLSKRAKRHLSRGRMYAKGRGWVPIPTKVPHQLNADDISGTWLALQYGWLPLLNDISDACQALEARTRARKLEFRVQSSNMSLSGTTLNWKAWPISGFHTVRLKAVFREPLSMMATLGLTSPGSVLWEKLPFSYVADWFIPIGDYLANAAILGPLSGTVVTTTFKKSTCASPAGYFEKYQNAAYQYRHYYPGRTSWSVSLTRTVGSFSAARPHFKSVSQAFSLAHLENAAALVKQIILPSR